MATIAVAGAAGRMGRRICALSREYAGLELRAAFERGGHAETGRDIGLISGGDTIGVLLTEGIESVLQSADLIIDFTAPEATVSNIEAAARAGRAYVTGTTGLQSHHIESIRKCAERIPVVMASNMSLGVNLLLKVLKDVAGALGDDYDVEIIEAHHKLKKDAPSGTAFMMLDAVASALGRTRENACLERSGMIGERPAREIGVQTIRGGDIVGEHTVMFCGMGERIEISHRVSNRDTFARGALRAASWLQGKPAGLYDMQDVLGLKG